MTQLCIVQCQPIPTQSQPQFQQQFLVSGSLSLLCLDEGAARDFLPAQTPHEVGPQAVLVEAHAFLAGEGADAAVEVVAGEVEERGTEFGSWDKEEVDMTPDGQRGKTGGAVPFGAGGVGLGVGAGPG